MVPITIVFMGFLLTIVPSLGGPVTRFPKASPAFHTPPRDVGVRTAVGVAAPYLPTNVCKPQNRLDLHEKSSLGKCLHEIMADQYIYIYVVHNHTEIWNIV